MASVPAKAQSAEADFKLEETRIAIKQVDFEAALDRDAQGYPRLDPAKLERENPRVIERQHRAIILENRYVRVTLLPEMGRVYSFLYKVTGHEQLWINAVAKPLAGQQNDLGWWMIWGGVEYTIPRGEHGTTWALRWTYGVAEDSRTRKAVRMSVLEPRTQLRQQVEISLYPDRTFYAAEISIVNTGRAAARFAHWINPMWAPGGGGEVTPNTELIVPCVAMRVADKDFNRWMLGDRMQEYEANPLRWVKHWRDIGDVLFPKLTAGFYSAFSHEANEGIVRIFDPKVTPGVDIWTWGYPPPASRQREYSLVPNLGYVEMWGGTARDFSDESRGSLSAGRRLRWTEWMYPYSGTSGLTDANREAAVNFRCVENTRALDLAICVTSPKPGATVIVQLGRRELLREKMDLRPEAPLRMRLELPPSIRPTEAPAKLILRHGSRTLVNAEAKPVLPLRWGFPYLPAPEPAAGP